MPTSTPDWSALASQHEKIVDGRAAASPTDPAPGAPHQAGTGSRRGSRPGAGRRWRIRGSQAAAAATAGTLALTGATAANAATRPATAHPAAAAASWHIVKRVHSGDNGNFTAVTAVGQGGGWAFSGNGEAKPTAWRRSGSSWAQVSFPGLSNERVVAAKATSPTNVWAFTDGLSRSRALRWNGHGWSVARSFGQLIGGAVVLSRTNVWVFGEPTFPGSGLGAWHYNGRAWTKVGSGKGLQGGSALSASSIWSFDGASVAHWNGRTWTRTSVAGLLPPRLKPTGLNDPGVTAIYARSATSVWALGDGNDEDDGGPIVILHYNGHAWSRATRPAFGGYGVLGQIAPAGAAGLWIPNPGPESDPSQLLHYAGGRLTAAALPVAPSKLTVSSVAAIPGTGGALAGGFTHARNNDGAQVVAVILQYGS
jgi:hypothetical protein